MIAGLFSDLDTAASGDIYYQEKPGKVIIQFNNVARYDGDGFVTFQIVLQPDGSALLYYKELIGNGYLGTVGLQKSTQTGMTVVHNQPYLKNNFAVRLDQLTQWLTVSPPSATLAPGATTTVNAILNARFLENGNYEAKIHIASPVTPDIGVEVPVSLRINTRPQVTITAPTYGARYLESENIVFQADAQDEDGIAKVEFFDGTTKIGEATTPPFAMAPVALASGDHTVTAHAIDFLGLVGISDPIYLQVEADADRDGLVDWWELAYFGDLAQGLNDDSDGDGLTNAQEFALGSDPTNPDMDSDGMLDGWEVRYGLDPWWNDDAGLDLDEDGQTNLQEFQNGTDPSDFFNGMPPVITIVQGGTQIGTAGNYNYTPITVEVRNSAGVLLANAPLTFTITQGNGTLSLTRTTSPTANVTSLSLRTDANGRAFAYFASTGPAGSTYQVAVNANTGSGGSTAGPTAAGSNLDPNGNEDNDGKTNDEEGKLGTNPTVFNLFAETSYQGRAESGHTNSDPLPWTFYTQQLTAAPQGWEGLDVTAHVVFDSRGSQYDWVVDDYASINGAEFVRLGKELIYDVTG